MAKPPHTRCTFEGIVGTVAAPLERWSFSVNFPYDVAWEESNETVDDLIAAGARDAYDGTISALACQDVFLTQVKVSNVGADGKVKKRADGSYQQGEWEGSVQGVQGAQPMPLQTALCVSLTTMRSGATGKGRFFLPWPGYVIQAADKRLTAAAAQALAENARDFLNALAAVFVDPPQVVSSKGYMSEVVGVRVGRVPDTMRSRREDLPEGYVAVPLA